VPWQSIPVRKTATYVTIFKIIRIVVDDNKRVRPPNLLSLEMLRITLLLLLLATLVPATAFAQNESEESRPQFEAETLNDALSETLDGDSDDQADDENGSEDDATANPNPRQDTLSNWPTRTIGDVNISLAESGRTPDDRSALLSKFGRSGMPVGATYKVFAWQAPDIRYQPLYFEDVALERYGQTLPAYRQTLRSAWHMTKSFAGLGFQMLETPPRSCDYPLGFCRPGTCVPQTTQRHFFGSLSPTSLNR
jgi:hypothetical protein